MSSTKNSITCTLAEAADILQVHPDTAGKLIAAGELPAGRVGKNYVILLSDVQRYVEKIIINQTADRLTKGRRPKSSHANLRTA